MTVSHVSNSQTLPEVYFLERLTPGFTVDAVNVLLILFLSILPNILI